MDWVVQHAPLSVFAIVLTVVWWFAYKNHKADMAARKQESDDFARWCLQHPVKAGAWHEWAERRMQRHDFYDDVSDFNRMDQPPDGRWH